MAYLALARKWRPKAFSEVVGQQHVVQALSNALDTGRVHHAFLFTGTRGVGKTTLARIFAKSLNCEQGTSAEPCQQCGTCKSIDEGRFVDLIEVDAASRTKVDDTREILENVHYAPTSGKFKVYLIDEVHMLSGHSFNAMLKTLEEPPEHVKFLFATTDPQKLPVTILSRCLQFNLRAMRPEQVENQLVKILGNEGLAYDASALQAIAKAADGSMRDGLSLLDQAIAQGGGEVRAVDVQSMLGTIKTEHTQAIVDALLSNKVDQALSVVADMADNAVDFTVALDEVLMQLYYLSLAQVSPSSITAADVDLNKINELAKKITPESLQLFYQIGLISKRDIALAPSLRVGFEMALLRMFAFEPAENEPSTAPIPESLSQAVSGTQAEETVQESASTVAPAQISEATEKKTLESVDISSVDIRSKGSDGAENAFLSGSFQTAGEEKAPENGTGSNHISPNISSNTSPDSSGAKDVRADTQAASSAEIPPVADVPPWESDSREFFDNSGLAQSAVNAQNTDAQNTDAQNTDAQNTDAQNTDAQNTDAQISDAQISDAQISDAQISDAQVQPVPSELSAIAEPPASIQPVDQDKPVESEASIPTTSLATSADQLNSLIAVTLAGNNEWGELVEQTSLVGMAKELAMNCAAERMSDERIDLCLSPKLEHLYSDSRFGDIKIGVTAATNPQIAIRLDIDDSDRETPAECLSRLGYEHEEQVRESMHSDPGVQFLMSEFNAKIKENSIKPLS